MISNGERAVELFDDVVAGGRTCPDLIIIDLNLPKKSGREVLSHLRAKEICLDVPVIILTSSDNQKDKDDVANLSPARYIRKPLRLDDFIKLGAVFKQFLYPAG